MTTMGQDQQIVERVELLRRQLAALPDCTASDRARATLDELRELLCRAGYHFERAPDEKPFRRVSPALGHI
jgi:hypothetical protein